MAIDSSMGATGAERVMPQQGDVGLRAKVEAGQVEARAVEAASQSTAQKRPDPEAEANAVQEAAKQLSGFLNVINSDLNISVDRDVNATVVKVINRQNDEVIRQIPSEEVLSLMRRMNEISEQVFGDSTGVLIKDQA
ncbi:flagellar protein FlaG [Nitrincola alkalilacustris]|uniref:flagellar protein FlaG n=1 Tax=Nitrincola alkalilacustris TaxID=1571224 RepID=UPI00124ECB96|nr:flagellar protein FlaG [Nitrincola alkalilacustris]